MPQRLVIDTAEVFEPLLAPARYKGAHGGRGSGKSHAFAELLVDDSYRIPGLRSVCLREVQKTLKESAKRLIEDKIQALGLPGFDVQRDQILTPGGGIILFVGMQDHNAESIKSLEGMQRAWIEEAQTFTARSLELLRPTIRAHGSEIWASWNPRSASDPIDQLFRGEHAPDNAICVKANWDTNPWFPQELREEMELDRRARPDRFAHIWLGEYEPVAVGAIWSRQILHENRRAESPEMERVVVAIDPAVSEDGDEHGIVVMGLGTDGRGYVLEDASLRGSPQTWGRRVFTAFDQWDADAIVIERNQGGDMCREVLRSVRPTPAPIEVVATKGKHVRAEPIASLYQLGKISHVGTFAELEGQMCQMTHAGYQGEGSPDRCDALVWAASELFPRMTRRPAQRPGRMRLDRGPQSWLGA